MRVKAMSASVRHSYDCRGKVRFNTFARAQKVAHRQAHRRHGKFTPYACEGCGGFHVGSSIGSLGKVKGRISPLLRYAVYAVNGEGPASLMGWSNSADGGTVAKIIEEQPGWRVTSVIERRRRA